MWLSLLALIALLSPAVVFGAEDFVPLTAIPAFEAVTASGDLAGFLNQLYRVCIGVAAVIAIIQIIRGGVVYMGGDSITNKTEGRNLVVMSLGGLILVLSPYIVFSVINPEILELGINVEGVAVDTAALQAPRAEQVAGSCGAVGFTGMDFLVSYIRPADGKILNRHVPLSLFNSNESTAVTCCGNLSGAVTEQGGQKVCDIGGLVQAKRWGLTGDAWFELEPGTQHHYNFYTMGFPAFGDGSMAALAVTGYKSAAACASVIDEPNVQTDLLTLAHAINLAEGGANFINVSSVHGASAAERAKISRLVNYQTIVRSPGRTRCQEFTFSL